MNSTSAMNTEIEQLKWISQPQFSHVSCQGALQSRAGRTRLSYQRRQTEIVALGEAFYHLKQSECLAITNPTGSEIGLVLSCTHSVVTRWSENFNVHQQFGCSACHMCPILISPWTPIALPINRYIYRFSSFLRYLISCLQWLLTPMLTVLYLLWRKTGTAHLIQQSRVFWENLSP